MKKILFYIVLISLLLTGCKSKTIYVPMESVRIEYKDRIQKDSIFLLDSVYFERYIKGDTVYLTKEKFKYVYRDKIVRDSVFKTDSIRIPYPVIEYEEVNRVSSFQHFQIWCGRVLLLFVVCYFGIKLLVRRFN